MQRDKQTNRQIDKETKRQIDKETKRQRDRETERQRVKQSQRQKDRKTERQIERDTERKEERKKLTDKKDSKQKGVCLSFSQPRDFRFKKNQSFIISQIFQLKMHSLIHCLKVS